MGGPPKTGTGGNAATLERRAKLLGLIKEVGLHKLDMTQTAKVLGCARSTLYTDLAALAEQIPKATAQGIAVTIMTDMQRARDEIAALLAHTDPNVRLGAVRTLIQLGQREQTFLEATGHFKSQERGSPENPHHVEGAGFSVTLWRPGDAPMDADAAKAARAKQRAEVEEDERL